MFAIFLSDILLFCCLSFPFVYPFRPSSLVNLVHPGTEITLWREFFALCLRPCHLRGNYWSSTVSFRGCEVSAVGSLTLELKPEHVSEYSIRSAFHWREACSYRNVYWRLELTQKWYGGIGPQAECRMISSRYRRDSTTGNGCLLGFSVLSSGVAIEFIFSDCRVW